MAEQLGVNPETLRNWVSQAEINAGTRPGVTTSEHERRLELEWENREVRRANAILRSASAFFHGGARPPTALIVEFIDDHKHEFGWGHLPLAGDEPICRTLTQAGTKIAPST